MAARRRAHLYTPDPTLPADRHGQQPCVTCGTPQRNRIHDLPDTTAEQSTVDARRLGERGHH